MEESFGPIVGVMKVESTREATKLMNDTEFGLTASVFSSDKQVAGEVLRNVNVGTAYWNCCDRYQNF